MQAHVPQALTRTTMTMHGRAVASLRISSAEIQRCPTATMRSSLVMSPKQLNQTEVGEIPPFSFLGVFKFKAGLWSNKN